MTRNLFASLAAILLVGHLCAATAAAAPDLVVNDISLSPTSPTVSAGTLSVTFRNIGPDDVDLPIFEFTNYCIYLDGTACHCSYIFDLAAGATNVEMTTACNPATAGSHEIRAVIDSDFDVAEVSESNNERTESFLWRAISGGPCTSGSDCGTGFCTDGVCCESACGGGSDTDCQACSVAAGAAVDGTCGPLTREAATSSTCRAAAGGCDVAERCSPSATTCPPDAFRPAGTECRGASGVCDRAEMCTGASAACPIDVGAPDGTSCDDGSVCNGVDACRDAMCAVAGDLDCDDENPCTADSCSEPSGCAHEPIAGCVFMTDGGMTRDDAAVADAGDRDTGTTSDTGAFAPDGATDDGGIGLPGGRRGGGGGCAVSPMSERAHLAFVFVVALALAARRRRSD